MHGGLEHLSQDAPYARSFWEWIGYHYTLIDIDGSPGSISLDLNCDSVPYEHWKRYEMVTNLGTTEHIANQENAFRAIHDLTMPNGLMIHQLPAQDMLNHGLANYNPKFFWMLARSNGYAVVHFDFCVDPARYAVPENILSFTEGYVASIRTSLKDFKVQDCGLTIVLRKVYDIDFVPPIDIPTGTQTTNKRLARRYWTVFSPNAFTTTSRILRS